MSQLTKIQPQPPTASPAPVISHEELMTRWDASIARTRALTARLEQEREELRAKQAAREQEAEEIRLLDEEENLPTCRCCFGAIDFSRGWVIETHCERCYHQGDEQ